MSFNSLFGLGSHSANSGLKRWYPLQDSAASTAIADRSAAAVNATLSVNSSTLAATGPNSWLTSSLAFTGSQSVNMGTGSRSILTGASAATILSRIKTTNTSRQTLFGSYSGNAGLDLFFAELNRGSSNPQTNALYVGTRKLGADDATEGYVTGTTLTDGSWHTIAFVIDPVNNLVRVRFDKSNFTPSYAAQNNGNTFPDLTADIVLAAFNNAGSLDRWVNGTLCDVSFFNYELSDAEKDQAADGPEPVNSVAPSLSGTQTEGQVLTCSSGTWGLGSPFSGGSNGTITYSYQWTRSDNGSGLNEANISGATASTYTLQAGDVGKHIRCWVRASNDGGYDVAADTASGFTGAIAGAGGGANRLLNLRRRAAAA